MVEIYNVPDSTVRETASKTLARSTISVIVPVYKVEAFLRPCMDSILAQTFTDFELILVDDGSPDNCGAICDEYAAKDSRVRVIHQENGGLSAARNAGIDAALGAYLSFVDSDDLIHPDMLRRMLAEIQNTNADICICDLQRFWESAQIDPDAGEGQSCQHLSGRAACEALYSRSSVQFTVAPAKLIRKELFRGIRFPLGKYHEDEATTYKLLYRAKNVAVLPNAFYYYRQNPDGIMLTESVPRRRDTLEAFEGRLAFFREHGEAALARRTEAVCSCAKATLNIVAVKEGLQETVPPEQRLSVSKALRILRKNSSDEKYTYYLAMVRPKRLVPHAYWRKIKTMLGLPKT